MGDFQLAQHLGSEYSTKFWDDGKRVDVGYFSVRITSWKDLMIGVRKYFNVEVIDDKISYRVLYKIFKKNVSSSWKDPSWRDHVDGRACRFSAKNI